MQTKNDVEVSQEITLWKENKIHECIMEFSCGGDSIMTMTSSSMIRKEKKSFV